MLDSLLRLRGPIATIAVGVETTAGRTTGSKATAVIAAIVAIAETDRIVGIAANVGIAVAMVDPTVEATDRRDRTGIAIAAATTARAARQPTIRRRAPCLLRLRAALRLARLRVRR